MDETTLADWYARYGYAVHRRCVRVLGTATEADDVLQEVFLRASRHGDAVAGESPLGWLYRVADHCCFDAIRRRDRDRPRDAATQDERAVEGRPDDRLLVGQVLAACKERVRDAAVLYYVDELTQDEVADRLGVSRKTVKEKLAQFREIAERLISRRGRR